MAHVFPVRSSLLSAGGSPSNDNGVTTPVGVSAGWPPAFSDDNRATHFRFEDECAWGPAEAIFSVQFYEAALSPKTFTHKSAESRCKSKIF